MERIAIYGKGGIGKTTIATNMSAVFAKQGRKMLHIGCDPKHDSSMTLVGEGDIRMVIQEILSAPDNLLRSEDILMKGRLGIDCIEAGGPEPGVGCGGRGITRMFEALDDLDILNTGVYDTVLFDVLGDVVCGGFAAPLRSGYAEKVLIVTSEEMMALYAANNICKAVNYYRPNDIYLGGLIVNLRENDSDRGAIERFADKIDVPILGYVERDPLVRKAEKLRRTGVEVDEDHEWVANIRELADKVLSLTPDQAPDPKPMEQVEFSNFIQQTW